jgi:mgtE-like transporter
VASVGDVAGLPSLWLATLLIGFGLFTDLVGIILVVASVVALVVALRSSLALLVRILRESIPILCLAGFISVVAGIAIERRLCAFSALPALLVLLPGHLSTAGALGGVLANRLSSKIHLGVVEAVAMPGREARADIAFVILILLAAPSSPSTLPWPRSPPVSSAWPALGWACWSPLIGGMLAVVVARAHRLLRDAGAVRLGLDPDTYGVPMVTWSIDLVGAFGLILAIVALGIG